MPERRKGPIRVLKKTDLFELVLAFLKIEVSSDRRVLSSKVDIALALRREGGVWRLESPIGNDEIQEG